MKKLVLSLVLMAMCLSGDTRVVNNYHNYLLNKEKNNEWIGPDIQYKPYGVKVSVECWNNNVKGKKTSYYNSKGYYKYNELEDGKESYLLTAKHNSVCTTDKDYEVKSNDKLWDNVVILRTFIPTEKEFKKDKR